MHIPVFVVYHSLPFIAFEIGSNGTVLKNEKKKYCLKESRQLNIHISISNTCHISFSCLLPMTIVPC